MSRSSAFSFIVAPGHRFKELIYDDDIITGSLKYQSKKSRSNPKKKGNSWRKFLSIWQLKTNGQYEIQRLSAQKANTLSGIKRRTGDLMCPVHIGISKSIVRIMLSKAILAVKDGRSEKEMIKTGTATKNGRSVP